MIFLDKQTWSFGQFYCDKHKDYDYGKYFTILGFYNKKKLIEHYYQICENCMKVFN